MNDAFDVARPRDLMLDLIEGIGGVTFDHGITLEVRSTTGDCLCPFCRSATGSAIHWLR